MTDRTYYKACVVCGMMNNVRWVPDLITLRLTDIDCPRCGSYPLIVPPPDPILNRERLYLLCGAIRSCKEKGAKCFEVNSTVLATVEGFNDKVLPLVPKDDNAKMILILQHVGRKAAPGESVSLDPELDYPISFSEGPADFRQLVQTLVQEDLLREVESGQPKIRVILTVAGRREIQAVSKPRIGFGT